MNSTLKYYEQNAQEFIQNTLDKEMSLHYQKFFKGLKPQAHILDAGCGSGRDSLFFKSQGYRVTAMDASKKMCDFATRLLSQEVLHLSFEQMNFTKQFDAIWASASLLHVPKQEILAILNKFEQALKRDGTLYASFKMGEEEFIKEGRFFNAYTQESFTKLIEQSPFKIEECYLLEDTRPDKAGEYWLNALLKLV